MWLRCVRDVEQDAEREGSGTREAGPWAAGGASPTVDDFHAQVERMHKLIEMYQKREKPKETFKDCVGELKAVQQAASLQAALKASEASETALRERCDELQGALERAEVRVGASVLSPSPWFLVASRPGRT